MRRTTILFFASLTPLPLAAQTDPAVVVPETLPDVVVEGKAADLLGVAASASNGQANNKELSERPILRRGELLETVPGVIITQHAGDGKANQYFLRGFNLDHGTDFGIFTDGMPVNFRTHAHGQGYADLNFLVPEFIEGLDYFKGPYQAMLGDLTTAGAAQFHLWDALPQGIARFTIGEHDYYRGVAGDTIALSEHNSLTLGGEYTYSNGPWDLEQESRRANGLIRFVHDDGTDRFTLTAMGYDAEWTSTDQIPQRAIEDGRLDRFGYVDPSNGGNSQRYSLSAAWEHKTDNGVTRANAWAGYYDLDLYSNFTYFLDDPVNGDQFNQAEKRWFYGAAVSHEWTKVSLFNKDTRITLGAYTQHDIIDDAGLHKTAARQRLSTVRLDDIRERNYSVFAEAETKWTDKFRTVAGLRGDLFQFDVSARGPYSAANSGDEWDGIVSPKLALIFGPWNDTEIYLNGGLGFHSNDARGVTTTRDPATGDILDPADPLVRTGGAELGVRTEAVKTVTATAVLWYLQSDSELVYVGDAGVNEPGLGSRRYGLELAAYWRPSDWFTLDAEWALSHARFRDAGDAGYIPNSVDNMLSAGITVGEDEGPFATLRARYFAPRPLEETNTVESQSSFLVNAQAGYRQKNWEFAVECLNLFNSADNDIEYYYTSRLPGEPDGGIDDVHLHPSEPRQFRLTVTRRW